MTTTVYIDLLFLENFLLDFFILYVTARINNIKFNVLKGVLGSLIGAFYVCLMYVQSFSFFKSVFAHFFIISSILFCVFKIRTVKDFLKFLFTYIAVSFILAGGIYFSVSFTGNRMILAIITGVILLLFMGKGFFMLIKHIALKKEFTKDSLLFYNDKTILLKAYPDTGNFLVDPVSKKSVVIISKNKVKEFADISSVSQIKNLRLIPCRTVSDKFELLYGFKPDKFIYDGKETDAVIAISKEDFTQDGYDAILNPLTLI